MINLELDINEVNLLLNALAVQPYNQVNALITKIQGQAAPQVEEKSDE